MSDEAAEVFANRDTPIPVVSITSPGDASSSRAPTSDSRHRLSASKLKDKLQSLGDNMDRSESPNRFSDKMFTMCVFLTCSHVYSNSSSAIRLIPRIGFSLQSFHKTSTTMRLHLRSKTVVLENTSTVPTSPFRKCRPTSAASTPA
jgi:hypothetical protein